MADSKGFENISEGERNDFVSTVGEIYKAKISDIEATLKKIRDMLPSAFGLRPSSFGENPPKASGLKDRYR